MPVLVDAADLAVGLETPDKTAESLSEPTPLIHSPIDEYRSGNQTQFKASPVLERENSRSAPQRKGSTRETRARLKEDLQCLHGDELAHLATLDKALRIIHVQFFRLVFADLYRYVIWLHSTWGGLVRSTLKGKLLNPMDFLDLLFFSVAASVVISILLVFCIVSKVPMLYYGFKFWSARWAHNLSLTNAASNMFTQLTQEQAEAAKAALSLPLSPLPGTGRIEFDIDVAKFLLQLSSLMYERGTAATYAALREIASQSSSSRSRLDPIRAAEDHSIIGLPPGHFLEHFVDSPLRVLDEAAKGQGEGVIADFLRHYGIEYAPVSELNAVSSAFAALYWDKASNWIVCAFKGTSPTEFEGTSSWGWTFVLAIITFVVEWVTDFTFHFKSAKKDIPGFCKVHRGFLDRLFPEDVKGSQPYHTIAHGIRLVADELTRGKPSNAKINLYFTGHSLGCAMASLAYARAVACPKDFGNHVVVRDGYIFAAPITSDVHSMKAFHQEMVKDKDCPRALWRITNHRDAVATALPQFGDRPDFPPDESESILGFAHLGNELKMRTKPIRSIVSGNLLRRETEVTISSTLAVATVGHVKPGTGLPLYMRALQYIPVVGRLVQHGTAFYWDQLERMGCGECYWKAM